MSVQKVSLLPVSGQAIKAVGGGFVTLDPVHYMYTPLDKLPYDERVR